MSGYGKSGRIAPFLPALVLTGVIGLLAAGIDRWATPPGGLRLVRQGEGFGDPAIRTGAPEYPRQAVDSDGFPVTMAAPARRVASQYWSLDEFVYGVVPPEAVVAVSQTAYLESFSNVLPLVRRYRPAVASDPERVLALRPDLLLVSNAARIDFCDLLRGAGVPVYRAFTMITTLDQIAGTTRLTGYLTGRDAEAAAEIAAFRAAIARARARRPAGAPAPRVLGLGTHSAYGSGTLFDEILTTLGARNVAAEGGLRGYDAVQSERIARWAPEWIVAGADPGQSEAVRRQLLDDPAIAATPAARAGRLLIFEHRMYLPLSPFAAALATALAEALYA